MSKKFFLRVRSRHPSHNGLRRNKNLLFLEKVVFRLGSTTQTLIKKEINSVESIRNSSDKLKMKALFLENNVPTAKHYTLDEIKNEEVKFPILAKKRFGSRGNGMVKLDNTEQLDEFLEGDTSGYYFEEYFNGAREYRLHVSNLGCFYACRKMRKSEATDRWYFNSKNCIWVTENKKETDENGEFLRFLDEPNESFNKPENWDDMVEASKNALLAVGLDIGAIDLRCKKDGTFIILETNSAPSFSEITHIKYVQHLKQLVNSKY